MRKFSIVWINMLASILMVSCNIDKNQGRSIGSKSESKGLESTEKPVTSLAAPDGSKKPIVEAKACTHRGITIYCDSSKICTQDGFMPVCADKPTESQCPDVPPVDPGDPADIGKACYRGGQFLGCCYSNPPNSFSECAVDGVTGGHACASKDEPKPCARDQYACSVGGGVSSAEGVCCNRNQACRGVGGPLGGSYECVDTPPTCSGNQPICLGNKLGAAALCCATGQMCEANSDGSPRCSSGPSGPQSCGQKALECLANNPNKTLEECMRDVSNDFPSCRQRPVEQKMRVDVPIE
jgi:hypothetical protein